MFWKNKKNEINKQKNVLKDFKQLLNKYNNLEITVKRNLYYSNFQHRFCFLLRMYDKSLKGFLDAVGFNNDLRVIIQNKKEIQERINIFNFLVS